MPTLSEMPPAERKSPGSPPDRVRRSTDNRDRRQNLVSVSHPASSGRSPVRYRFHASFPHQRGNRSGNIHDVDASPWEVGKAAVLDENGIPIKKPSVTLSNENDVLSSHSSAADENVFSSPNTSSVTVQSSSHSFNQLLSTCNISPRHSEKLVHPVDFSSPHMKQKVPSSPIYNARNLNFSEVRARGNNLSDIPRKQRVSQGSSLSQSSSTDYHAGFITPVRTMSNLETEIAKQKIVSNGSNCAKKQSKVTFRASVDVLPSSKHFSYMDQLSLLTISKDVGMKTSGNTAILTSSSGFGVKAGASGVHEKSVYRNSKGRGNSYPHQGNEKTRFEWEDRKTRSSLRRSTSTAAPEGFGKDVHSVSLDLGNSMGGAQLKMMRKSLEVQKLRGRRSRDHNEEGRVRGLSGWFNNLRAGGSGDQETGTEKSAGSRAVLNVNKWKETSCPSSPSAVRTKGAEKEANKKAFRDDHLSAAKSAYDSEEDNEDAAIRGRPALSLAKDDFVAYQTSVKKNLKKSRRHA